MPARAHLYCFSVSDVRGPHLQVGQTDGCCAQGWTIQVFCLGFHLSSRRAGRCCQLLNGQHKAGLNDVFTKSYCQQGTGQAQKHHAYPCSQHRALDCSVMSLSEACLPLPQGSRPQGAGSCEHHSTHHASQPCWWGESPPHFGRILGGRTSEEATTNPVLPQGLFEQLLLL